MLFLFVAPDLCDVAVTALQFPDKELAEARFIARRELNRHTIARLARRLAATAEAVKSGQFPIYLHMAVSSPARCREQTARPRSGGRVQGASVGVAADGVPQFGVGAATTLQFLIGEFEVQAAFGQVPGGDLVGGGVRRGPIDGQPGHFDEHVHDSCPPTGIGVRMK